MAWVRCVCLKLLAAELEKEEEVGEWEGETLPVATMLQVV
jgi:hypothetical protein